MTKNMTKRTQRHAKQSRAERAKEIRAVIRVYWRTHSDRQMAEMAGCSNRTISNHRQKMEEAGEILPRFDESTHPIQSCLKEVCTFAIEPAPENDKLYDPVREDDPAFLALVKDIRENGIINPIGVSADGFIFDGHRRHAAARCLGMERITVRIDPGISHLKDLDTFLRRLRSCNEQRVKNTAEVMRESLVTMEPDTWQRVCDYRKSVSNVDGAEVFRLVGKKKRSGIVQKRGLADAIVQVTTDYYEQYGATSDRKIFYLLMNMPGLLRNDVRKTPFENSDECYQDVTNLLTRLRLDGSIPFEAIEDETRPVVIWDTHRNVRTFIDRELDNFLSGYWRDLLQSQPNHVELLVEKNTVANALRPIAEKYRITMTSGRGYSSLPPRKAMVDRFRASGEEKLVVLVVSDFDPEGQDIPNAFGLSLRDDFGIEADKLVVIKAALTHQQTQELDLHEGQFAKEDSSRYQRFVDAYGDRCWELEAVPTDTLRDIVEGTIQRTVDMKAFHCEVEIERQEQDELDEHRQRVREALADIEWNDEGME
jgi:ParB/Sulfiredoxin domain